MYQVPWNPDRSLERNEEDIRCNNPPWKVLSTIWIRVSFTEYALRLSSTELLASSATYLVRAQEQRVDYSLSLYTAKLVRIISAIGAVLGFVYLRTDCILILFVLQGTLFFFS